MSTLPKESLHFISRIQNDINEFFKENGYRRWPLLHDDPLNGNALDAEWIPTVDINERENEFVIHADLAGVSPEDTEVYMDGTILVIKGERKQSHDEKLEHCRLKEIEHGVFERHLSMPDTVDPEDISATSKNGTLTIKIAKRPAGNKRVIQIKPE